MKLQHLLMVVCWLLYPTKTLAQPSKEEHGVTTISLPVSQFPFVSFYVNDEKKVFLPFNGGIYLPQDSIWFLPPAKQYYFTSVAPNLRDTAFFAIGNTMNTSELFYVRTFNRKPPVRYSLLKLEKGIYNVIYKNKVCYIWGFSSGQSKIGVLIDKQLKWLFNLKGVITQVQVNDSSEIFFAVDNAIYQLSTGQRILTYQGKLYGFDFNKNQQIVLSCDQGVGFMNIDNKLNIIAKNAFGLITVRGNSIFALPAKGRSMYKIASEPGY